MHLVHINGITQAPGINYVLSKTTISFSSPPPAGADIIITEVIDARTGATHITRLNGNGSTFLYKLDTEVSERVRLNQLFETAIKYKDIPAVTDAINKLNVVLELVKEDDPIR